MRRIQPFFPLSHGISRVDDRRIVSRIIHALKHGWMWRDAPKAYRPHTTICGRFIDDFLTPLGAWNAQRPRTVRSLDESFNKSTSNGDGNSQSRIQLEDLCVAA